MALWLVFRPSGGFKVLFSPIVCIRAQEIYSVEARVRRFAISRVDLGLFFVVLVWGFSPILFKFALEEIQPLAFVFVRFVLLSAVAIVVRALRGARGGAHRTP